MHMWCHCRISWSRIDIGVWVWGKIQQHRDDLSKEANGYANPLVDHTSWLMCFTGLYHCPTPDCTNSVFADEMSDMQNPVFDCVVCHKTYCMRCNRYGDFLCNELRMLAFSAFKAHVHVVTLPLLQPHTTRTFWKKQSHVSYNDRFTQWYVVPIVVHHSPFYAKILCFA